MYARMYCPVLKKNATNKPPAKIVLFSGSLYILSVPEIYFKGTITTIRCTDNPTDYISS